MSNTVSEDGYVYTEEEMKIYSNERASIYKGTITICVIYSVIAFILILIGYFTEWGRDFLLGTILPFVITYIIGTIVIIIILADWVSKYKPRKIDDRSAYDNDICPDYWNLQQLTDEELGKLNFSSNVNRNLMNYKCVLDSTVIDRIELANSDRNKYKFTNNSDGTVNSLNDNLSHLYVDLNTIDSNKLVGSGTTATDKFNKFKDYAAYMINYENYKDIDGTKPNSEYISLNDDANTIKIKNIDDNHAGNPINKTGAGDGVLPLTCDTVYPLYLSAMDLHNAEQNKTDPKNLFRCAYAKACGVPWTEAGCIDNGDD
jgi:hypothetical protein